MDTETFSISVRDDIELRFIKPEEAEALYKLVTDNRAYLREWLDWVDAQTGPEVSKENILKRIKKAETGEMLDLGIYKEGELIGSMGFNPISAKNKRAEIGYWISSGYQGKGMMTECVRALIGYGFKKLKLHRIEIHCSTRNAKSFAIPEKLGFTLDGVFRDSYYLYDHFESSKIYSMLAHEWKE